MGRGNDSDESPLAGGASPSFKAHPSLQGPTGARSGGSTYQGREFVSEDEWHARRRPESIDEIVDRLMTRVARGRAGPAAVLRGRWREVVGEAFADKTRPGSCESGRLVILVADGATASKMRFTTSQIMQKATAIAGEGKVTSIVFRVTPGLRP